MGIKNSLPWSWYKQILALGVPPQLSGSVCAFHPAARVRIPSKPSQLLFHLQSNLCYNCHCIVKRTKINKKRPGLAHLKKQILALLSYAALKLNIMIGCSKSHDFFNQSECIIPAYCSNVSQRRIFPQHLFCSEDDRMVVRVQGQSALAVYAFGIVICNFRIILKVFSQSEYLEQLITFIEHL